MTAEILYESTAEASIKRSGLIENGDAINGFIFLFDGRLHGRSPGGALLIMAHTGSLRPNGVPY